MDKRSYTFLALCLFSLSTGLSASAPASLPGTFVTLKQPDTIIFAPDVTANVSSNVNGITTALPILFRSAGFYTGIGLMGYGLYKSSNKHGLRTFTPKLQGFCCMGLGSVLATQCMQPTYSNYAKFAFTTLTSMYMAELVRSYIHDDNFNEKRPEVHLVFALGIPLCFTIAKTIQFKK